MSSEARERIERLMEGAVAKGVSAIVLAAGEPVAYRSESGVLRGEEEPLLSDEIRSLADAVVGAERVAEIGPRTGAVSASFPLPGKANGLVNVTRAREGYAMTITLLPPVTLDVAETMVPEAVVNAAMSSDGMAVFCGHADSGKEATALSVVEHINRNLDCLIATVEDPAAVRLEPKRAIVQQREVGLDVPDAASGIRAAMKQGADFLFVPEINGFEELLACVTAAERGVMVITCLDVFRIRVPECFELIVEAQPCDLRAGFREAFATALRVLSVQVLVDKSGGRGRVPLFGYAIPDANERLSLADGPRASGTMATCGQTLKGVRDELKRQGVITQRDWERAVLRT